MSATLQNPDYWFCTYGPIERSTLPEGADLPLRMAVQREAEDMLGEVATAGTILSSGWGNSERVVAEMAAVRMKDFLSRSCGINKSQHKALKQIRDSLDEKLAAEPATKKDLTTSQDDWVVASLGDSVLLSSFRDTLDEDITKFLTNRSPGRTTLDSVEKARRKIEQALKDLWAEGATKGMTVKD